MRTSLAHRTASLSVVFILLFGGLTAARGEAMLQLFQMKWSELSQKMPELAEAGYTSLWLPVPAKGGGLLSVGYDLFDPFDLGDKYQNGTVATKYGTKAELLEMVETAHRFGIRVYFDNIMNHRQGVVPGYDVYTPTNFFPGLLPQDFHLKTTSSGNRNWPNVEDWGDQDYVQNEPINGLCDLATEPGGINYNFGPSLWSQASKPFFVRHPANPEYYMDTNTVALGSWAAGGSPGFSWPGGTWHAFNGTNGQPVAERVEDYLTRAAMWTIHATKCDGFRLDAVKHVPSPFFGDYSTSWRGYLGGIQAMFDFTHGYGSNVRTNGYPETDDNRNSCFDTEAPRNDAMVFGEHLGSPPSYGEYISTGMRLLNSPLRTVLNGGLQGGGSLPADLDQPHFIPYDGAFSAAQGVQFAEDHDHLLCCPTHRELQNAYYFMHEGLPMIYSDNFNWAGPPGSESTFPQVPMTCYLGQFGDNTMPETCYIHNQMARGGTRPRWSDSHIVAFERYDYRDVAGGDPYSNPDATVVLFAMNATYNNPSGDVLFDDGIVRADDGYYNCYNGSPSKGFGLVVGFPPGSVLSQMASSSPNGGNSRTCAKLLVHEATTSQAEATSTAFAASPAQRKIYVAGGQVLAPGGGAIELLIPAGGWVMYGYQWPEPSRANVLTNAITFRQGGAVAPTLLVTRRDGSHGDPGFGPVYPFKMRGSVDSGGNVLLAPGEGNLAATTSTYSIRIPVLTNAPFDMLLRSDASAVNMAVKLDGGLDLNSHMGLGPGTGFDRRDNRPGYVTDVWLGYEQALQQFRYGPEKFGARLVDRNTIASPGAETYKYTVGTTTTSVVNGAGGGLGVKTQTADWVYHDPAATNTAKGRSTPTQRIPYNPGAGQPVDIWIKSGYQFQIDKCFIYYTTDGTNPEGAFGVGKGTTQVVEAGWQTNDVAESTIDWWKGTIPAQSGSPEVRYKVALFKGGVYGPIEAISDADGAKLYGLTQFGITNFNPTAATVWLHNNLNTSDTTTGLRSGFHIVRARAFLPRSGKSAVYNTFLQTFYYAGQLPGGVIAYPATDGATLTSSTYTVVVRADSSTTAVDYCITDNNGQNCGTASAVSPDGGLSQQYPNYPQEFRFAYSPVASSGTATIDVYLKDTASSVYPERYTTVTRTINAQGPATVLNIVNPSTDGQVLTLNSNDVFTISSCFTATLTTTNYNLFSIYINGVFQPRQDANSNVLYNIRPFGCGTGMRQIYYNWRDFSPGTNTILVTFSNGVNLSASRTVLVGIRNSVLDTDGDTVPDWLELLAGTDPGDLNSFLRITHLVPDTPAEVTWASVPGKSYQVLATTNLHEPMQPIVGAVVPASLTDPVTRWFDSSSGATNRFYRIQVLP
ncbi:MAG TPA: alpha-amylase family glycosyl hydrolase [Candidatus Paceibacterota bacterium]|nr:alpha-amylase family glycosyl hydrolase [Verrucomicrobiota bacterium]HSA09107.1 alpha-amylase family glycosyl hydrolase [Candidatus Paceibacterota bacterium]